MLKTKLLISLFACGFTVLTGSQLEAKHHSHSHFNMQINAGAPARNVYVVQPQPVVVQTAPVYVQRPTVVQYPTIIERPAIVERPTVVQTQVVHSAIVPTATPVAVYPQYYTTPTYVVQQQPVVVAKKARPSFSWGFNWGLFFR